MGKRNIIEKEMTSNMERINRGQIGEDRKPEVKGCGKCLDRNGIGENGDKARNSDTIKYLKLLHFSPRC
jgi:hypothetical protein